MKAIVDYRIGAAAEAALLAQGCGIVKTMPLDAVYPEICGHPDIQLHAACDKIICAPQTYEYYKTALDGYNIVRGSYALGAAYPYDIAYNVCRIGKYAVCNVAHTAPEILNAYSAAGVETLDTKQGYAKCSICVVSDTAAITADAGIYKLLTAKGIDVLKIAPGHIGLYGMDGFIGGASGLIKKGLLNFNGRINTHPDGGRIKDFCKSHGVVCVSLHGGKLTDIGSILVV